MSSALPASWSDNPIVDEYLRLGATSWSDARLVAETARRVATPRRDPADSFVLHAPLELAARAALLPHVAPDRRDLARMHLFAVGTQFDAYDPIDDVEPSAPLENGRDPVAWLADALAAGDLGEVDRAATTLADRATRAELVAALTDLVLPLTGAAAHAPIFLYQLRRIHPLNGLSTQLLRPLARELARVPDWRIRWVEDVPEEHTAVSPESLGDALRSTPAMGVPGSSFIHPLYMQVDESGVAASQLAGVVGEPSAAAAHEVLRTSAWSMLLDDEASAPYGWSHCLTIPQAVLGVSDASAAPSRALAVAATSVAAFRAGLGSGPFEPGDLASVPTPHSVTDLATAAAASHDAHLAKYVLACLDQTLADPEAAPLYLSAASKLVDLWAERGDPTDPLADLAA